MTRVRPPLLLGVGLCVLVGAAVAGGSATLDARHAASIDVLVAAAPPGAGAAPLLPGGAAALDAVRARAASTARVARADVAQDVEVFDSQEQISFDYDKPSDRRLNVVAHAPREAQARALAVAFANAYVRQRARFSAAVEKDRLQVLPATLREAGAPSPQPIRNGLLAALVCLLSLTLVHVLRRPPTP